MNEIQTERSPAENSALDQILPAWGKEETPMDKLTLAELEQMTETAFALKNEITDIDRVLERKKETYNELQRKIHEFLSFHHKTDYRSASGLVDIREKLSFKVPKTEEEKKDFFAWLKYKNIFWQYASVNSNSLNSLLKDFWDDEQQKWKEPIAGVQPPTKYQQIYFTKRT